MKIEILKCYDCRQRIFVRTSKKLLTILTNFLYVNYPPLSLQNHTYRVNIIEVDILIANTRFFFHAVKVTSIAKKKKENVRKR